MTTALLPSAASHERPNWPRLLTAADLANLPTSILGGDVWYELDDGIPVVHTPQTAKQSRCWTHVLRYLHTVESSGDFKLLGRTGVVLRRDPDRVVGPAISLLDRNRWPPKVSPEDFLETIPDLIVEIRGKKDTILGVGGKVAEYLVAGVIEVWMLDPELHTVATHTVAGNRTLRADESLTSELLPAFRVAVDQFFAE